MVGKKPKTILNITDLLRGLSLGEFKRARSTTQHIVLLQISLSPLTLLRIGSNFLSFILFPVYQWRFKYISFYAYVFITNVAES